MYADAQSAMLRWQRRHQGRPPNKAANQELLEGWRAAKSQGMKNKQAFLKKCFLKRYGREAKLDDDKDVIESRVWNVSSTGSCRITRSCQTGNGLAQNKDERSMRSEVPGFAEGTVNRLTPGARRSKIARDHNRSRFKSKEMHNRNWQ